MMTSETCITPPRVLPNPYHARRTVVKGLLSAYLSKRGQEYDIQDIYFVTADGRNLLL